MNTISAAQRYHDRVWRSVRTARVTWAVRAICAVLLVVSFLSELSAQDAGVESVAHADAPALDAPSEGQAFAMLIREAAQEAAAVVVSCGPGPMLLRVMPEQASPVLVQVFAEELMARGLTVRTGGDGAGCRMTVEARGMFSSAVSTGNSSYFRRLDITLGILLEDASGNVAYSRERQLTRGDTLRGDMSHDRRSLLDAGPSWHETWLEPLLVTATAVVIAVLLFTVRGSS